MCVYKAQYAMVTTPGWSIIVLDAVWKYLVSFQTRTGGVPRMVGYNRRITRSPRKVALTSTYVPANMHISCISHIGARVGGLNAQNGRPAQFWGNKSPGRCIHKRTSTRIESPGPMSRITVPSDSLFSAAVDRPCGRSRDHTRWKIARVEEAGVDSGIRCTHRGSPREPP